MPRKRDGSITESLEDLLRIEAAYRGKPEAVRIRALRLLKEQPELQIEEVAGIIGYAPISVKRWLKAYKESGLGSLIERGVGGKVQDRLDGGLSLLKQKLLEGEFQDLRDVQQWAEKFQSAGTRGGGRSHSSRRGAERHVRPGPAAEDGSEAEQQPNDQSARILDRLLTSMPSLAASRDVREFGGNLRSVLLDVLGDVDHIVMSVNLNCPIDDPTEDRQILRIRKNARSGVLDVAPMSMEDENIADRDARYIDGFWQFVRGTSFQVENYHVPSVHLYHYGDIAYIGFLGLWRERTKPPISDGTLATMERLKPFILYAISDFIAREHKRKPVVHMFDGRMATIMDELAFTLQERRILQLQFLGSSYVEIADILNISVNTVRSHVKSIYTKTDTHSQAEFFAKYFTPYKDSTRSDK